MGSRDARLDAAKINGVCFLVLHNRAQRDSRYQVSEAKRQRRIDRQTLVVNGDAIGAAWQTTATVMRAVGVTGLTLTAVEAIGKNLLRYRDGQVGKGASDTSTDHRKTSEWGQKSFLPTLV
ncbi:MAG: hypothetical protein ACTHJQ_11560 [Rhizobiaceae bacterium]